MMSAAFQVRSDGKQRFKCRARIPNRHLVGAFRRERRRLCRTATGIAQLRRAPRTRNKPRHATSPLHRGIVAVRTTWNVRSSFCDIADGRGHPANVCRCNGSHEHASSIAAPRVRSVSCTPCFLQRLERHATAGAFRRLADGTIASSLFERSRRDRRTLLWILWCRGRDLRNPNADIAFWAKSSARTSLRPSARLSRNRNCDPNLRSRRRG